MSEFHLNTHATLKHINPRKEGPDDDKVLALDLKFTGQVEVGTIAKIHGNPWVWALTFKPLLANIDTVLADPGRYGIGGVV